MRAVLCKEWGELEKLGVEEVPRPQMTADGVRVRVHAAGVNFADSIIVEGRYQHKPPLPFTPGFEVAGTVLETAPGVTTAAPGDRVIGVMEHGAFAEEVVVPGRNVFRIPGSMDFVTAAGFPIAYGTSHGALDWRARLKSDETLLVHGAAGGVGLTAVEVGKAMGATVIAAAGGPEKLAIAREHGADHLVDYRREDLKARVRELTEGRGADVVYDPVGGDAFDASLRCIAWQGRIVIIGFASGRVPQIPANIMLVKNCDVLGFYWGSYRARAIEQVRRSNETLFGWFEEGRLKPRICARFDLADAARAIDMLRSRKATGKVVLTTGR